MRPLLGSTADPLHPSSLVLLAGLKPASPKLQKAVWQDLIREDDARQMDVLIAKLDSMRAQKAPDTKPAKPARKDQSGNCFNTHLDDCLFMQSVALTGPTCGCTPTKNCRDVYMALYISVLIPACWRLVLQGFQCCLGIVCTSNYTYQPNSTKLTQQLFV